MAKKTIATLNKASKKVSKVIKMVKSNKTGAYIFVDKIVNSDKIDEFFSDKQ